MSVDYLWHVVVEYWICSIFYCCTSIFNDSNRYRNLTDIFRHSSFVIWNFRLAKLSSFADFFLLFVPLAKGRFAKLFQNCFGVTFFLWMRNVKAAALKKITYCKICILMIELQMKNLIEETVYGWLFFVGKRRSSFQAGDYIS